MYVYLDWSYSVMTKINTHQSLLPICNMSSTFMSVFSVFIVICLSSEFKVIKQEGDAQCTVSKYGNYKAVFRAAHTDGLYLMMKDCQSKRSFSGTFSKSKLIEMKLTQPIDKIINLLQESRSGNDPGLKFKIGFRDAQNTKTGEFDKLINEYVRGYAMYISVSIDHSYFGADYIFELLEQKRSETDILHDIIYDMQQEIDQLKDTKIAIGSWYSNHRSASGIATLHGSHLEPTLEGMAKLADDKNSIVIGMDGLYRVTAEPNWTGDTGGTGHYFQLQVNGNAVATKYGSKNGGFGHIERLLNLKKNDKIAFNYNHHYAMNQQSSYFTVQKL
eukprot:196439_1